MGRVRLVVMRSDPRYNPSNYGSKNKKIVKNHLSNALNPHSVTLKQSPYLMLSSLMSYLAAIPEDRVRALCLSSNA